MVIYGFLFHIITLAFSRASPRFNSLEMVPPRLQEKLAKLVCRFWSFYNEHVQGDWNGGWKKATNNVYPVSYDGFWTVCYQCYEITLQPELLVLFCHCTFLFLLRCLLFQPLLASLTLCWAARGRIKTPQLTIRSSEQPGPHIKQQRSTYQDCPKKHKTNITKSFIKRNFLKFVITSLIDEVTCIQDFL